MGGKGRVGRVASGMCTRCGIIREGNLLYARRRFVDAIRYTDRTRPRFWKRVNDEVFHNQLYPFDILDPATLDTKFYINNIEAFEIFFFYVCTFL